MSTDSFESAGGTDILKQAGVL